MSVKASISLTEHQDAFARDLVAKGQYSSMSAVMQHGLDLLRRETERRETEIEALRVLIEARRTGAFVSLEDGLSAADAMITKRRAARGL